MSIKLNDSIRVEGGKPVEDKRLNNGMPWESVEQVNASIPITDRYLSLEVLIGNTLYWYRDSTEDYGLVVRDELNMHEHNVSDIHDFDIVTNQKIEQAVSDLKIGGRNYILRSNVESSNTYLFLNVSPDFVKRARSEYVTLSFELSCDNVTGVSPRGRVGCEMRVNYIDETYQHLHAWREINQSDINSSLKVRFFNTIKVENKEITSITQIGLHIQFQGTNTVVSKPKLEISNISSDWSPAPEDIFDEINTRVLKTSSNINTSQAISGYLQHGRNIVTTGTANLVVTVDSEDGFCATYQKGGAGSISFQAGTGKTLVLVDNLNVVNGAKGSTATVTVVGNEILLRIANG